MLTVTDATLLCAVMQTCYCDRKPLTYKHAVTAKTHPCMRQLQLVILHSCSCCCQEERLLQIPALATAHCMLHVKAVAPLAAAGPSLLCCCSRHLSCSHSRCGIPSVYWLLKSHSRQMLQMPGFRGSIQGPPRVLSLCNSLLGCPRPQ